MTFREEWKDSKPFKKKDTRLKFREEWKDSKPFKKINLVTSFVGVLAFGVSIAALILTIIELKRAQYTRGKEAEARRDETIARSWEALARKAPGNSGKIAALEYLVEQGQSLSGIDISCPTMGGRTTPEEWKKPEDIEYCEPLTYLRRLDISRQSRGSPAELSNADLSWTNLSSADLRGARLWDADLRGAWLWNADLRGADLEETDLRGAWLQSSELQGAKFKGANLSRTNFTNATFDEKTDLDTAWAVAGFLPLGLPEGTELFICKIETDELPREKPFLCIPPDEDTLSSWQWDDEGQKKVGDWKRVEGALYEYFPKDEPHGE